VADECAQVSDRIGSGGLDRESKAGGEARCAEHAQVVLAKARLGIADGADQTGFEIRSAANIVKNIAALGIEQEGVDGEIATEDVLAGIGLELHRIWTPAIGVSMIAAEGGDFYLRA